MMKTGAEFWLIILTGVLPSAQGILHLAALPARTVSQGQTVVLQCTYRKTGYSKKHCVFVWSHSTQKNGHQKILYSSTSNPHISFSGSRGSRLTIHSIRQSGTGRYMCHYICGGLHTSTTVDIDIRGPVPPRLSGNFLLRNPQPTTSAEFSVTNRSPTEDFKQMSSHYGGLIALGAMVTLLVITALCAVKVSKQRCCYDSIQQNRPTVDTETTSASTESSSTSVGEPPSYDFVLNQNAQYFQGVMGRLFTRVLPANNSRITRVPKCQRCGQNRRLAPRRVFPGRTNSITNLAADDGPYYISVCCNQVLSPADKPPEYWAWVSETKTTNMFPSQTAPPLYAQISRTVSPKVITVTKSSSLSKKSNTNKRPALVRSLSDNILR